MYLKFVCVEFVYCLGWFAFGCLGCLDSLFEIACGLHIWCGFDLDLVVCLLLVCCVVVWLLFGGW